MYNILQQPQNYQRFAKCSVAIQILVCLILLILIIKEGVNFYKKNYIPYMFMYQIQKKYEQNTGVMIEHNSLDKNQYQVSPRENASKQQQQGDNYMRSSKDAMRQRQAQIAQNQNQKPKSQVIIKQNQKVQPKQEIAPVNQHRHSLQFKINLSIERAIMKLPIFGIMIINIVLITSYQFLAIVSYIAIILIIFNQLVNQRWTNLAMILEIITVLAVGAGFINAYVTPRVSPF